jgi:elongation factor G
MNDYSSSLRSITQGRAKFNMQFHEYAVVPFETQRKLTEQYNKVAKEEMVG